MDRDTFQGKRHYVARIGDQAVAFKSYWAPDTFGLGSDAIEACKRADITVSLSDWSDLVIEGPFATRWRARRTASRPQAAPAAGSDDRLRQNVRVKEKAPDLGAFRFLVAVEKEFRPPPVGPFLLELGL